MNPNFLDFEQPIADLIAKIDELRFGARWQFSKYIRSYR